MYDEEWDSDDEIPLSRLRRSDSTELVDLLVNLAPDIYNSNEVTEWLNDEIETTDDETDENDEVESFNEECCKMFQKYSILKPYLPLIFV